MDTWKQGTEFFGTWKQGTDFSQPKGLENQTDSIHSVRTVSPTVSMCVTVTTDNIGSGFGPNMIRLIGYGYGPTLSVD